MPVVEVLVALIAASAAALAVVDRASKRRATAMLVAVVLAPALIAADQWHATQVEELRNSPALLLAACLVAGTIVVGLAALMYRRPVLLPVLVLIALPFRVPLTVGGEDANLLMPLYLVMAAGVLVAILRQWRGESGPLRSLADAASAESGGATPAHAPSGFAAWMKPLLAASVILFALGLIYSDDRSVGLQNLCFFLVPFAVVFALMDEVEWDRRRLRIVLIVVLAEALVCAAVGFAEYRFKELLWNETVMRTNDFHVYFRVNSLFWDPNVYGRYLAVAITVAAGSLLWVRDRRDAVALSVAAAVLWLALVTTFSQSSFVALLAGLAVLIALRWSLRLVLAGLAVLAVGTLLFAVFAGGLVKLDLGALNKQTSGRANLVEGGVELFGNRPVLGYGSGSFSRSFKDEIAGPDAPVTESHTEPITVAAEQGLVGFALYAALIVAALFALAAGFRAVMPGLGAAFTSGGANRGPPAARAVILASFVSVLVHTVTYADFLNDPVTWVLMAIGYSLAFPCRDTSAA
ncbi:MAG: O-antigen ligase family protein [Solirubrobacterales bacterium]|nr:O-antigen ligase family protein [Solirubrobacterales bacterium]